MTGNFSEWRSELALPANLIQSMDAKMAAYVIARLKCYVMHDAFSCSNYDVHILMDVINDYFREELGSSGYAMFPLI